MPNLPSSLGSRYPKLPFTAVLTWVFSGFALDSPKSETLATKFSSNSMFVVFTSLWMMLFPLFIATFVPSPNVPKNTFPKPPIPITILSSKLFVASKSSQKGKNLPNNPKPTPAATFKAMVVELGPMYFPLTEKNPSKLLAPLLIFITSSPLRIALGTIILPCSIQCVVVRSYVWSSNVDSRVRGRINLNSVDESKRFLLGEVIQKDIMISLDTKNGRGSEVGGTEPEALRLIESTEVRISSSVDRREVESRSDLKFLLSTSTVWSEDPQSMRVRVRVKEGKD
ncbi:putative receptor-like protein kinase [Senna tora]|uniref:Putative receptor-like protein kinase n=1 Tax=Senna tora TaxID=362788 RepID=A0A834X5Z6_9FABA|nr:putative receptor-like protein kinase [Senna tora]